VRPPAVARVKTTSLNEGLERSGHTRNVSFPIGGEPVMQQAAGCLGQIKPIVVPRPSGSDIPRYAQCKLPSVMIIAIRP